MTDNTVPKLIESLKNDIDNFVGQQQELMFNEGDFQIQLAVYLRLTGHYDDVRVEYCLPNGLAAKAGYDWDSNLYLDIVVRRGDSYCPVELKYPTKGVVKDARRFGSLIAQVQLLRNHGAQDIARYNFWKDVRRIEIIRRLFPKAKNGIAVMLTNDASYTRPMRPGSAAVPFSMHHGHSIGGGTMDWQGAPSVRKDHQPFHLDGSYSVKWTEHTIDGEKFFLTTIII